MSYELIISQILNDYKLKSVVKNILLSEETEECKCGGKCSCHSENGSTYYLACIQRETESGEFLFEPCLSDVALWKDHSTVCVSGTDILAVQKEMAMYDAEYVLMAIPEAVMNELNEKICSSVAEMRKRLTEASDALSEYAACSKEKLYNSLYNFVKNSSDDCIGYALTSGGEIVSSKNYKYKKETEPCAICGCIICRCDSILS